MSEKLSERTMMIDRALDETLRPHAVERQALRDMDTELAQVQADLVLLRQERGKMLDNIRQYAVDLMAAGEELAQAQADVEALLKVRREYEAHGYHPTGLNRCEHGMSRWIGSHCAYDSHALTDLPEHLRGASR